MFAWLIAKNSKWLNREIDKKIISRLERGIYLLSGANCQQAWVVFGLFIVVSAELVFNSTPQEINAVVAHERGHIFSLHLLRKKFYTFLYNRGFHIDWTKKWHSYEFAADAYAVKRGHAKGLIGFLSRNMNGVSYTHPSSQDRIDRISKHVGT